MFKKRKNISGVWQLGLYFQLFRRKGKEDYKLKIIQSDGISFRLEWVKV